MNRILAISVVWLMLVTNRETAVGQAPGTFEEQVSEYIRRFPYQVTYDFTLRYTRGDPQNLNRWVTGGEPALVRAGDDILPRTNNDTYYKGAALFLENGPVTLESGAPA